MNADLRAPLHLAVHDQMADWQFGHATAHVRTGPGPHELGHRDVVTVGLTGSAVTTAGGLTVLPDISLPRLKPSQSAMLLLVGSPQWEDSPDSLAPLASAAGIFLDAGVPVAAIGSATVGLAREGLLDYRDHTGLDPAELLATGYAGGHRYRADPVVSDGDLLTAGPSAPLAFAREILLTLGDHSTRELDSWYLEQGGYQEDAWAFLTDEG